jgi:hypothetical protein
VSSPYQYPLQWRKSIVPHGPLVSGPTFAIPCGAVAPGKALPTAYPKPPEPTKRGATGDAGGRFDVASTPASAGASAGVDDDEHAVRARIAAVAEA